MTPDYLQYGALGLCAYLIYVNRKTHNGLFRMMIDVIKANTEANTKLSDKLDQVLK
jgi:hypothetical protein